MRATNDGQHVTRRIFMQWSAAGVLGAVVPSVRCGGQPAGETDAKARRPNIVFILADDLGWADVGYHGSAIDTPNIDRLAREGVRFGRHYVMPTCTPTRVGFMTGRYPSRYGVTAPAYGKIFDDDTVTVAEALRRSGYFTGISGKWHMGSPPDYTPLKYGFDSSYGYFHGQVDPYTHVYKTGVPSWHRDDRYLEEQGHATDLITAEAIRVIEAKHDRPFFLYVTYSVPHYPLDEPEAGIAPYQARFDEASRRWYAASVTHMDAGIGRIVAALDRQGLRRNTLIVFVSDNGGQKSWQSDKEYGGRYADKPHTVLGDNRPLRGWKGDVYEGGIRVPALANWPGGLRPGQVNAPIHIVDWMPTLCGLVGYRPEKDPGWDGRDVWSLIDGSAASAEPRSLYWKAPNFSAVRLADWKLVLRNDGRNAQLFDLACDPHETQDLADRQPERVAELLALWKQYCAGDR